MSSLSVQYLSDLHLEFHENVDYIKHNPLIPKGEILIIAGDLVPFARINKAADFIQWASDNFDQTLWLIGNHEVYHFSINKNPINIKNDWFSMNEKIRDNFRLVNNVKIEYKGIDLIFSTLWTEISPTNQWEIARRMSDFMVIKKDPDESNPSQYFSPFDCTQLHKRCRAFIEHSVKESTNKKIVITHHVPTFKNYPEKYKGDILNEAFAVEMHDFIEESKIDYWQYAHNHYNQAPFKIGNTELITNQLGYVKYGENKTFQRDAIIEI